MGALMLAIVIAGIILVIMVIYVALLKLVKNAKKKIGLLTKEKHEIEIQLHDFQRRFSNLFDYSVIGLALINLDGHFINVNRFFCELFGYTESEMLVTNFYYLIHPTDVNNLQINIQSLLDKKIAYYKSQEQSYRKNGEVIWIASSLSIVRDDEMRPVYFMVQIQDITTQKRAEERLHHMVYHDPLTSLANRNKLEQFLQHVITHASRYQEIFVLLLLDIDRFKNVNDTVGHEAGDLILQIIAERLRSVVRVTDLVARLGDDEFVIVATDIKDPESAAYIARKLLSDVFKPVVVKTHEIYLTASIGISTYPDDGKNIQTIMKHADLALSHAKENGGNNYQFYLKEMTIKAQQKISLHNALGQALANNEFTLYYQPKIEIKTRKITGIEALLRWENRAFGKIATHKIIQLVEETGLIVSVTDWILKTACNQLKKWHDMGYETLSVAVHFSSRPFKQTRFVEDVLAIINDAKISPSSLEVEVTEGAIISVSKDTLNVLHKLKESGVQLTIDNFGTGYWSMHHVKDISVDKIKIDKSYIKHMLTDEISAAIVRAIIAMANNLNIKTIAEGVETKEQYLFIAKEGCTELQGYYLTKPLSANEMTNFLNHPIPDAEVISKEEALQHNE